MSHSFSLTQALRRGPLSWLVLAVVLVLAYFGTLQGQNAIDGFTQPFLSVDLSSDESGAILSMSIEEGAFVEEGDLICKLDDRIQQLHLEMAEHQMNSKSDLDAARRSHKKREIVYERLQTLRNGGHASESELIRSEMEMSISKSKFLAAQEAAIGREIEFRRTQMMLERRNVRAPFTGKISKIHRFEGEFVSPLRPEIVTLVQTDKLLAVFNVSGESNLDLKKGQKVTVRFLDGRTAEGVVFSVGVVLDAESGTMNVKVRLDNADDRLQSGLQCQLEL